MDATNDVGVAETTSDETGRVVYLHGPDDLELREHPVPEPEPGAVVAEIEKTNVCGSDIHIAGGRLGEPFLDMVLGHEAVCRIAELGEGVETDNAGTPVEPGDLVAPVYYRTCNSCYTCAQGEHYNCLNSYSHKTKPLEEFPHFHGTYGTHYYIHPDQHFYTVPEELESVPEVAAAANCALSQVMFGLDKAGIEYGDTVVVQGAGGLGLNALAYANERGAETIAIEGAESRLERAAQFGADHLVDMTEHTSVAERVDRVEALTDGRGADIGVEVAGVPEAFREGVQLLRDGGRYVEMGNINPGSDIEFDPGIITRNSIEVHALVQYDPHYLEKALGFLADTIDTYPYTDLLDAEYDLTDVESALDHSASRDITRASLVPNP